MNRGQLFSIRHPDSDRHYSFRGEVVQREAAGCVGVVDARGVVRWIRDGTLHRDGDAPAIYWPDGSYRSWWQRGRRHRDGDEPASIATEGARTGGMCRSWYRHDLLHREWDLPAIEFQDGCWMWWRLGVRQTPAQIMVARRWSPLRAAFFCAAAAAAGGCATCGSTASGTAAAAPYPSAPWP